MLAPLSHHGHLHRVLSFSPSLYATCVASCASAVYRDSKWRARPGRQGAGTKRVWMLCCNLVGELPGSPMNAVRVRTRTCSDYIDITVTTTGASNFQHSLSPPLSTPTPLYRLYTVYTLPHYITSPNSNTSVTTSCPAAPAGEL